MSGYMACRVWCLVFGALMLWNPESGAVALVWVIGMYSVFFGLFGAFYSFQNKERAAC